MFASSKFPEHPLKRSNEMLHRPQALLIFGPLLARYMICLMLFSHDFPHTALTVSRSRLCPSTVVFRTGFFFVVAAGNFCIRQWFFVAGVLEVGEGDV